MASDRELPGTMQIPDGPAEAISVSTGTQSIVGRDVRAGPRGS
jgi:hypothetical protein